MNTILQVAWALRVLWQQKEIKPSDRLRLWRKSINLYVCFLAFADEDRSVRQLHGAMICAVASALYDYDTDWKRTPDPDNSIYFRFIRRYVANCYARHIGYTLFKNDHAHALSADGLERGSLALEFYAIVIGSRWMKEYSQEEIHEFGRLLQILDDLLDLEEDRKAGHTNCFLTADANRYRQEVIEFLKSDFFKKLEGNSIVYCKLKAVCLKQLSREAMKRPTQLELWRVSRPHNGVFAFLLTLAGFRLAGWTPYAFLAALAFAGLTLSIMVFNELVDRTRDAKKGKLTASLYPLSIFRFWKQVSLVSLAAVALEAVGSPRVALFCLGVWVFGLIYSFTRRVYPLNNLIVAVCAGSPVICGVLYRGNFEVKNLLVFGIIFGTILIRERLKDVKDMEGDRGYKVTAATLRGHMGAILPVTAVMLPWVPLVCLALYPAMPIKLTTLCFLPLVFCLGVGATRRSYLKVGDRIAELFLTVLLLALICA